MNGTSDAIWERVKKREVKWVRDTLLDYTEIILPDIIAEAWATLSKV